MKKYLYLSLLFLMGCSKNSNPVSYIKDVVALREGDGFQVYFVLADASGLPTAISGAAVLNFEVKDPETGIYRSIYTDKRSPRVDDFEVTTVGRGPFEKETVLFNFGRYPDAMLQRMGVKSGDFGRARVTFSEDHGGKTVGGESPINF
ncbi:hypothetical protein [Spirosoma foliorum]|uniref:Uncharacterized protein n=1 Tax=Spirosoma foliorum TaxID=2710596 RepID=A0A7G5H5G5_9BACT|nr:hypothetical protein [Spirosoma foliorum]QMW06357.1 hypothetical protein H3H32_16435 [Spirosoma foliorum]